jgi:hypothetical protein
MSSILQDDITKKSFDFEIPEAAKAAIARGIERGDCVVEMEAIGLSQRTVNALEFSEYKIVRLKELMNCKPYHLMTISNIGVTAIKQLMNCLKHYEDLEKILEAESTI